MLWPPFSFPDLVRLKPEQFCLMLYFLGTDNPNNAPDDSHPTDLKSWLPRSSVHQIQLPPVLIQMMAIQFQIWLSTGFGSMVSRSEQWKKDKIRVCWEAGPSYVHYITKEELLTYQDFCNQLASYWMI